MMQQCTKVRNIFRRILHNVQQCDSYKRVPLAGNAESLEDTIFLSDVVIPYSRCRIYLLKILLII